MHGAHQVHAVVVAPALAAAVAVETGEWFVAAGLELTAEDVPGHDRDPTTSRADRATRGIRAA